MSSIIIADSHTLCREALCHFIKHAEPNVVVEGVSDYRGLREHLKVRKPDLILIDQELGNETIFDGDESLKVGLIVSHGDVQPDFHYPLSGIFPRTLSSKDFLLGIQSILSGKNFVPAIEVGGNFQSKNLIKKTPQDFNLTAREREVLSYLVKGASNKDIARSLNLQVVTVKLHVRGICRKTKAANRTQAALIAIENGWA